MSPLLSLNNPVIRILSRIVDLILLNCLFILFSLPIITIGASVTALYSVTIKITKSEDSHIWKNFITSFRKNFKQSTIIWLMALVLGCILLADFYFLDYLSGVLKVFFMFVTFLFGFIYLSILLFVFPYTARFEDTIHKTLLNSLLIGFFHFHYLLLLMIFTIVPIFLCLSSFVGFLSGIYFVTFGGFALSALLNSFIFKKVFLKYEKNLHTIAL